MHEPRSERGIADLDRDLDPDLHKDFELLLQLAGDAQRRLGVIERRLAVGGVVVHLRIAGADLDAAIWPALSVRAVDATTGDLAPDLAFEVWDCTAAELRLPELSLLGPSGNEQQPTWHRDDRHEAWFQPIESAISFFDHATGHGCYCVRAAAELPAWEPAAPLRALLRWGLADRGLHMVHAAGIGTADRGVLLAGRGGSGKSTTTALAALAGLSTVGDDYVVVDPTDASAHALYRSVKLDPRVVGDNDRLVGVPTRPAGTDKVALWLDEISPGCLVDRLPIDAIAMATVGTSATTRYDSAAPADALRALAPSTMLQLPGDGAAALAAMTRVAERVPAVALELGTDLATVGASLQDFLRQRGWTR